MRTFEGCIKKRDYQGIHSYLSADPSNVSSKLACGLYPLQHAICYGDVECTTICLECGADANLHDKQRTRTPLMIALHASWRMKYKIVELLLDAGADINAVNGGTNALHFAIYQSTMSLLDMDVACLIVDRGASFNFELDRIPSWVKRRRMCSQAVIAILGAHTVVRSKVTAGQDINIIKKLVGVIWSMRWCATFI